MSVYFAHITDTHILDNRQARLHSHQPNLCAVRLVDTLNQLPKKPDFVIHTGDVVDEPSEAAYTNAQAIFSRLKIPIYFVAGNHDNVEMLLHYLPMGDRQTLAADRLVYSFNLIGERFLVLDARGKDYRPQPQGWLPDEQLELVRREATSQGPPLTIFMHYPTHSLNASWMDINMLVMNGDLLHEALLPAKERIRGVFHGHVHRPMQIIRDGIVYCAARSSFAQLGAWPNDETIVKEINEPPGYNFVHCIPNQTIIHQHTFLRPQL